MKYFATTILFLFSLFAAAQPCPLGTGDGVTDDYLAIQNALNSSSTTVSCTVGPGHVHAFGTRLVIPSNKTFNGRGATLKSHPDLVQLGDNAGYIQSVAAAEYTSPAHPIKVTEGSYSFTTAYASNITVGKIVLVTGGVISTYPNGSNPHYYGWYSTVVAVRGNTVTMKHPAVRSFTGNGFKYYSKLGGFTIKNWTINFADRTSGFGMHFENVTNVTISNVTLFSKQVSGSNTGALRQGIHAYGVGITINSCNIYDGPLGDPLRSSGAYAIAFFGQDVVIKNTTASNWAGRIVGGARTYQTKTLSILNCTMNQGNGIYAACNFHEHGGGIIKGNTINGNRQSRDHLTVRGDHTIVEDNIINVNGSVGGANTTNGILIGGTGAIDLTIKNNYVNLYNWPSGLTIRGIMMKELNPGSLLPKDILIEGNRTPRIRLAPDSLGTNVVVRNNFLKAPSGYYPPIQISPNFGGHSVEVSGNTFKNDFGNSLNYSVNTNSQVPASLLIVNNKFYLSNCSNTQPQIVLGTTTNVTQRKNTTYTCPTPLAGRQTTGGQEDAVGRAGSTHRMKEPSINNGLAVGLIIVVVLAAYYGIKTLLSIF